MFMCKLLGQIWVVSCGKEQGIETHD